MEAMICMLSRWCLSTMSMCRSSRLTFWSSMNPSSSWKRSEHIRLVVNWMSKQTKTRQGLGSLWQRVTPVPHHNECLRDRIHQNNILHTTEEFKSSSIAVMVLGPRCSRLYTFYRPMTKHSPCRQLKSSVILPHMAMSKLIINFISLMWQMKQLYPNHV